MGMMDLFNQGDVREKLYAAAAKNNVPQGGITGKLFSSMFPHGLGNLAFGRDPKPMPPLETPEGTALMADLASNMMVPGTFIGPKGLARLFGDDAAKGMLATAESKLAQGVPKEAVFQELGVFKGPEGKWRYEIDDSGMTGIGGGMGSYGVPENPEAFVSKVGDAVNHDTLFAAHPSLRYMNLEVNPAHNTLGSHYEGNIALKGDVSTQREWVSNAQKLADEFAETDFKAGDFPSLEEARGYHNAEFAKDAKYGDLSNNDASTLLHELQHAVQGREGFAAGGSPEVYYPDERDMIAREMFKKLRVNPAQEAVPALDVYKMAKDYAAATDGGGRDIYNRLAGEAEARAVQDRMNMNMDERRALFPEYAGRNDLIVRGLMSGF